MPEPQSDVVEQWQETAREAYDDELLELLGLSSLREEC